MYEEKNGGLYLLNEHCVCVSGRKARFLEDECVSVCFLHAMQCFLLESEISFQ